MMELKELQEAWKQYDKKLTENLKLNEELLKTMNLDKSKNELDKPMYGEIASVIIMFLLFLPMTFYGIYMIKQPMFSILSFICAVIFLMCLIFSIIKIKAFLKIDYLNTSIVLLQQQIASLKMRILKLRKVEIILAALLVFPFASVLMKWMHNFDVFTTDNLIDPIIRIIIAIAIGFPATIWLNKHFYDKRISNAQYYLHEIEKFSKEEESISE